LRVGVGVATEESAPLLFLGRRPSHTSLIFQLF